LKPSDGKPKRGLNDFQAGCDNKDNVLRGRKFYRHHGHAGDNVYWMQTEREHHSVVPPSEQNRTVKDALEPGNRFQFTIEFENLSEVELGALLWSLEMDGRAFHRLGFAKPLGFGSVQLQVLAMSTLNPLGRYGEEWQEGWSSVPKDKREQLVDQFKQAMQRAHQQAFEELPHIKDLLTLLSDPPSDLPIHYPRPDEKLSEEGKNYEWFIGNNRKPDARVVLELPGEEKGLPLINRFGEVSE
jgi:CRISPR-associated protein (TIGR03986 family)